MDKKYKANPVAIVQLADRKRCAMCKHREDEGHLLPNKGSIWPSPAWMLHYQDTHGLPHQVVREWIIGLVYGMPINEGGLKHEASQ